MSPSLYWLLVVKGVSALFAQGYSIAYAVVFSTVFGMKADVSGYLWCAGTCLSIICLYTNQKLAKHKPSWGYPWDITLYFGIVVICMFLYIVFMQPWLAYSAHLLCVGAIYVVSALEMTTRLYLSPSQVLFSFLSIFFVLIFQFIFICLVFVCTVLFTHKTVIRCFTKLQGM